MSTPNPEIYFFEDKLEEAVQAHLLANKITNGVKQRDDAKDADGKKAPLETPRVEVKVLFQGFPTEHVWISPTNERWLDIGYGQMLLKIVTRRDGPKSHAYYRGMCRWLMQNRGVISAKLTFHILEKIVEQSTTISISGDETHDISVLSFNVAMKIKPTSFPQT